MKTSYLERFEFKLVLFLLLVEQLNGGP